MKEEWIENMRLFIISCLSIPRLSVYDLHLQWTKLEVTATSQNISFHNRFLAMLQLISKLTMQKLSWWRSFFPEECWVKNLDQVIGNEAALDPRSTPSYFELSQKAFGLDYPGVIVFLSSLIGVKFWMQTVAGDSDFIFTVQVVQQLDKMQ